FKPLGNDLAIGLDFAPAVVDSERLLQPFLEQVFVEWFFEHVESAVLDGTHGKRYVGMAGEDNDRNGDLSLVEDVLQFQSTHAGQADIDHDTADAAWIECREEIERILKLDDFDPDRFQRHANGVANVLVVLDQAYRRAVLVELAHGCALFRGNER